LQCFVFAKIVFILLFNLFAIFLFLCYVLYLPKVENPLRAPVVQH
jgi:hypothetical protein